MTDKVEPKEEKEEKPEKKEKKSKKDKYKKKSDKPKRPKSTPLQKVKKQLNTQRMRMMKRVYLGQMALSTLISVVIYAPGNMGIASSKTTNDPYLSEFSIHFDSFSPLIMFS